MGDPQDSIRLPPMLGGVHRHDEEAVEGQVVDALDVFGENGGLRRRPGLRSFAHGPMLHLPEGMTRVWIQDEESNEFERTDRVGRMGYGVIGVAVTSIIVGCDEPFDGIDFRTFTAAGLGTITAHKWLEIDYWNGSEWTPVPWFLDRTRGQSGNGFVQPLTTNGTITWHSQHLVGWDTDSYGYAVRLRVVTAAGVDTYFDDIAQIEAPGIRCFLLAPVNGLIPSIVGDGKRSLLVCGDRTSPRGMELGAQIGHVHPKVMTETLHLVGDEGGAVIDVYTWPRWRSKATADAVYVESAATASPTTGTAGRMTKGDRSYNWNPNQWSDARHRVAITPVGTPTTASFEASIGETADGDFEHAWLLCTTTGGTPSGEYVQVVTSSYDSGTGRTRFNVYPLFSVAPTGSARFTLLAPPMHLRADQYWLREWPIRANDSHTLTLETETQRPYGTYYADVDAGPEFTFQIGNELRWLHRAGRRWNWAMCPATRTAILTNGEGPLMQWDGYRLRVLEADDSSVNATSLAALIPDGDFIRGTVGIISPALKLRSAPPRGAYLHTFKNRFFVGPLPGADRDFAFSEGGAAGSYNDIWPIANRASLRDRFNLPLRGFFSINGRFFPFTASSIHEAGFVAVGDTEALSMVARVEGVGFLSHHAVGVLPMGGAEMAIGPTADGIGAFNGSSIESITDDWSALVDGGANVTALQDSVATVLRSRTAYVLAFAPRGTQSRTRILWLDMSTGAKWIWRSPFGVSSLATVTTETGEEKLLVGTEDGFISTLCEQNDDDSEEVEGYIKTAPMRPYIDHEALVSALVVTAVEGGEAQAISVQPFIDRSGQAAGAARSLVVTPVRRNATQAEQPTWASDPLPEFADPLADPVVVGTRLSENRQVTSRLEFAAGLRAHTIQFRISGTWLWRIHSLELLTTKLGIQGRR